MLIYKDDQMTAERRDDMLRVDVRARSLGDGLHTDAWLPADEALFLAESILKAFQPAGAAK